MKVIGSVALALLLALGGACGAQTVVKQEPWEGKMEPGQVILVDDGTCGKAAVQLSAIEPRCACATCFDSVR
jgi:hypothetical protein